MLDEQGAEHYFDRSDAFDLVLNLGGSGRARRGLADAMTIWIRHLLGVEVTIEAVARMDEENWAWFVGLDSEATRIGNALWRQEEIEPEWLERIIGLFRLEFIQPLDALPMIDGRSVWLILAMTEDRLVRMKPQNLMPACRFGPAPGCTDMAREVIEVGVVVERRKLKSPGRVLLAARCDPAGGAGSRTLDQVGGNGRGGPVLCRLLMARVLQFRDDRLPGQSRPGTPKLWVVLREVAEEPGVSLLTVTADPAEGESLTEPGTDIVEQLAMPPTIVERLSRFVATHHVERAFVKGSVIAPIPRPWHTAIRPLRLGTIEQ